MTRTKEFDINANAEPQTFPVIASTHWDKNRYWYVSELPRKVKVDGKLVAKRGEADWGYTDKRENAIPMSQYWWRRFRHDSHYCNRCAHWSMA